MSVDIFQLAMEKLNPANFIGLFESICVRILIKLYLFRKGLMGGTIEFILHT